MPSTALVWDPALTAYELSPEHPLKPVRLALTVELMRAYGLLADPGEPDGLHPPTAGPRASILPPRPASDEELGLVHESAYVDAVKRASSNPRDWRPERGLGTADDPVFAGMHEVSALIAGGAIVGMEAVVEGRFERTFNIAGGLHHAQRDRASGFCVYNDPAIAIAWALRAQPHLRVAYVDIDAHHGDGVEAAFWEEPRVLTVSIHESGRFLFPGTGFTEDVGGGGATGYALNVPLPPLADDECYRLAFEEVVSPALRAFGPDLIVAQCGCDAHFEDPLTHLGLTLRGHRALARGIVTLADELCGGSLVACGGGGYGVHRTVPRAWTNVLATLLGIDLPEELPTAWREHVARLTRSEAPRLLTADEEFELSPQRASVVREETRKVLRRLQDTHPLLGRRT